MPEVVLTLRGGDEERVPVPGGRIGRCMFQSRSDVVGAVILPGVTAIEEGAFGSCTSLTALTFLGDAPKAGEKVFSRPTHTIYRKPKAKGWGDTFAGRPVKLISEKP